MRTAFVATIIMLLLQDCRERRVDTIPDAERKSLFLPAITFIAEELNGIDSLPLAILRYRTGPGIADTAIVPKPVFRNLMQGWFGKEFAEAPLQYDYQRKIFQDATLGRITITCDTDDTAAAFQRFDMLMEPETEAIRSIYVEKVSNAPEGTVLQKLFWSAGRQCRISKTTISGPGTSRTEDITYSWGNTQPGL